MSMQRREEIAASVAAHQDLGPGYDRAVAEGLVERIGAEVDNRVAAELDRHLDGRYLRRPRRGPGTGPIVLIAMIWIIVGVINVAHARKQ